MGRRRLATFAVAAFAAALFTPFGSASAAVALPSPNSNGLTTNNLVQDGRMVDVTVSTAAIFQPIHVRIYLPADYETNTSKRYPSLYLLQGGGDENDDALSWTVEGDVENIVNNAGYSGIVVMPEAGKAGWYRDWVGPDAGGHQPLWETFHIDQLLPWVDANFRTMKTKASRSVAGLSMGGFGALSYSLLYPQLFSSAGTFSGPSDILSPIQFTTIAYQVVTRSGSAITNAQNGQPEFLATDPNIVFGSIFSWLPRNPFSNAAVYRQQGIKVAIYGGSSDTPEQLLKPQNDKMHWALRGAGVNDRYCTGEGVHNWPYWQQDLADFLQYASGTTPAACPNGWGAPQS